MCPSSASTKRDASVGSLEAADAYLEEILSEKSSGGSRRRA